MNGKRRRHGATNSDTVKPSDHPATLRINGRTYDVLDQLSMPSRGRWKVRDPQPRPRGMTCTAILLDRSPSSDQLERSLRRLPEDAYGLPKLLACGVHDSKRVWILSWKRGTPLEVYLQKAVKNRLQRPSVWESIRRIKSLAHSLQTLWGYCQIVHGDIKPTNLILPSDQGSIFLTDFGSSWQVERTNFRVAGDGFHPHYAAPELMIPEQQIDFRVDQFSAGVVLYEMLTLERPYKGLGGKAGLPEFRSDIEREYEPPSTKIDRSVSIPKKLLTELDLVVGRLLKLDSQNRFSTPNEFVKAMDRLVEHFRSAAIGSQDILMDQHSDNPNIATSTFQNASRAIGRLVSKWLGDD
ncbi:MAG: protein kinase [Pirellulaceae bacterium]|nr:protein kinase [Pirellulaceae bacterium]